MYHAHDWINKNKESMMYWYQTININININKSAQFTVYNDSIIYNILLINPKLYNIITDG